MPVEHHHLTREFPEMRERIHVMKTTDNHFARLFEEYNTIEHAVQRIESGIEAASDDWLEQLKKERLRLKDALFGMLNEAA